MTVLEIREAVEWDYNATIHKANIRDCGVHAAIPAATLLGALTEKEAGQCHADIRGTRISIGAYGIDVYEAGLAEVAGCSEEERKEKRRRDNESSTQEQDTGSVIDLSDETVAVGVALGGSARGKRFKKRTDSI